MFEIYLETSTAVFNPEKQNMSRVFLHSCTGTEITTEHFVFFFIPGIIDRYEHFTSSNTL